MSRLRTIAACAAGAILALSITSAVAQTGSLPGVLGPTLNARVIPKAGDPATVQARVVRPDVALLDSLARHHIATRQQYLFVVDLFPGLDLEAEVIAAEARPGGGTTLFARLTEVELGSAVFTIEAGVLTATVDFPGGSYLIAPQVDGNHQVARKAAQFFPPERAPREVFQPARSPDPRASAKAGEADVPLDSGRLIDVMIVWTPAAEGAAGGLASMQNLAQAAIDSSNAAYLNSGVAQRLRLVHRQQVAYTERTNCADGDAFGCGLDDLTDNGDGYLDNVHALRDTHGADLVALLIHAGPYCGLAWLPSSPSSHLGFSVTAHHCAVGNRTFAHELGHNMGAHHDPDNASAYGPKPFNKGYISPQLTWRTVMSYAGPCGGCTRLGYFSNPKLSYGGDAMGTAEVSNNAHVLNFTAKAIAAYRPTSALHPVTQRFADVAASHPFFGQIEFFAQAGISTGCAVGLYCPDAPVSRRQMAAFLERAMRASNWTPATNTSTFTDVAPLSQFAGHVEAMRTDGITTGCTATQYCPEQPMTRAQMAVFVLRARCGANYLPNMPMSQTFADVPLSHAFVRYIEKLNALGITGGCAAGLYCPDAAVTRGQMAAFVERAYPIVAPSEACAP